MRPAAQSLMSPGILPFPVREHAKRVCVICRGVTRMAKTSGCALSGFVLVKKVPGALHFLAKSPGHSFDYAAMNMSHVVNYLYFGNKPSPRRHQVRWQSPPVCFST